MGVAVAVAVAVVVVVVVVAAAAAAAVAVVAVKEPWVDVGATSVRAIVRVSGSCCFCLRLCAT